MLLDFFKVTPSRRAVKFRGKKGILFSNPNLIRKCLFYLGNLFLLSSIIYIIYLYWPIGTAVVNYWSINRGVTYQPQVTPSLIPVPTSMPVLSDEYNIVIPKLGANSTVVENVSPYDSKEYLKVLETNVVAAAKGTDTPGMGVNHMTYIFAHSTRQGISMARKNAVFYLLGELRQNDEVQINYHGTAYAYRVYKQEVVEAKQTEFLNYKEADKEVLILQTCWPIGTDWKRLLVFAERVEE